MDRSTNGSIDEEDEASMGGERLRRTGRSIDEENAPLMDGERYTIRSIEDDDVALMGAR
jgi:hypothetical protein